MIKYLLLFAALPLLGGCLPDGSNIPKTKEEIKIISGNLGKEQFFIPKGYFKEGMADFNGGTISLQMIQPEFIPFVKSGQQMLDDGEHTKLIRVLANEQRSKEEFSPYILNRMGHFYAFEKLRNEFGLTHFTQPKGYVQDWDDVWVESEGKENISYITCDDDNSVPFPQCTHAFEIGTVYVQIHYDKRILPEWKRIQNGVLQMFDSFQSPDKARDTLFQKYTEYKLDHKIGSK